MLAANRVEYDLLSLGVHGHELQVIQLLLYFLFMSDIFTHSISFLQILL